MGNLPIYRWNIGGFADILIMNRAESTSPLSGGATLKKIAVIPALLTLGNGICGFAAIAMAGKIDGSETTEHFFFLSGWLIVVAMLFDSLDGYVARLSKTTSRFGVELDSLCDAVSFGVAPAFLLLRMGPGWQPEPVLHQLLACLAALYMICAVLRLARFNVEIALDPAGTKRFRGLPSPAAAGCIASLAILRGDPLIGRWFNLDLDLMRRWLELWTTVGALAVSLLMVSRIPYPHLTKQMLRGRRHFSHLIQIVLGVFVVVWLRELALVLIFWVYGLGIPAQYAWRRSLRPRPAAPGLDEVLPH
jgi:CDP-diacylglycerol--serine O-phosphatidyltransferase